jgi:hypothetical protein
VRTVHSTGKLVADAGSALAHRDPHKWSFPYSGVVHAYRPASAP